MALVQEIHEGDSIVRIYDDYCVKTNDELNEILNTLRLIYIDIIMEKIMGKNRLNIN